MSSSNYHNSDTVHANVEQGKTALYHLKGLSKALQSLQSHAKLEIDRIEKAFGSLFLHDGINSAPDDVLAMIFENAITSTIVGKPAGEGRTVLSIVSVNRRFRSLALQQPVLWSILPYKHTLHLFNLFLERSGDVALTVYFGPSVPRWYTEAVMLLGYRWGHIVAHSPDYLPQNGGEIDVYPRLHTVQLEQSSEAPSTVGGSWTVPSLRRLSVQNIIPALFSNTIASLTSFTITSEVTIDMGKTLLQNLGAMQNLEELSLSFGSVGAEFVFDSSTPSRCNLASLRRLRLVLNCGIRQKDSYETFHGFLDRIATPTVQKFEIIAVYRNRPVLQTWTRALFRSATTGDYTRSSSRFPSLEHMSIDIMRKGKSNKTFKLPVDDLFQYPEMKHLYISTHSLKLELTSPQLQRGCNVRIRTMTIETCKWGVCSFLQVLLSHINPDGSKFCDIIEKLVVIDCPEVTMNFLLEYLPGTKIELSYVEDN